MKSLKDYYIAELKVNSLSVESLGHVDVFSLQDRDNGGIEPFLASIGLYSTLIQPF